MFSSSILGILPTDFDLLLECYWNIGLVDMELLFLLECGVVHEAMGTLLLGFDFTAILGVVWVCSSSLSL